MLRFSIYTLSVVHAEFKLLYIVSMPTVLPSDNQLTGFQCRHAWRGPEHKTGRFEVLRLPGASTGIWLYDRSVTPKHHDSKRKGHGDKSLCSLHAVPLDSRRGRDEGGLLRFYR